MFKKVLLIGLTLLVGLLLAGCNGESSGGSYGGYLKVNNKQYVWQGNLEDEEFTVAEKIGEVNRKLSAATMPEENFSSNILEAGDEIFTSNENEQVLIVIRESDGEYEKFAEEGYFKEEND